jgi:hypothetical protein
LRLGEPAGGEGCRALLLTVGKEKFGYYLEQLRADFGRGFRLVKFSHQVEEGEPGHYDILIDPRDLKLPLDRPGRSTCDCKGHLTHGHKTACKHLAAIRKLLSEGSL